MTTYLKSLLDIIGERVKALENSATGLQEVHAASVEIETLKHCMREINRCIVLKEAFHDTEEIKKRRLFGWCED